MFVSILTPGYEVCLCHSMHKISLLYSLTMNGDLFITLVIFCFQEGFVNRTSLKHYIYSKASIKIFVIISF